MANVDKVNVSHLTLTQCYCGYGSLLASFVCSVMTDFILRTRNGWGLHSGVSLSWQKVELISSQFWEIWSLKWSIFCIKWSIKWRLNSRVFILFPIWPQLETHNTKNSFTNFEVSIKTCDRSTFKYSNSSYMRCFLLFRMDCVKPFPFNILRWSAIKRNISSNAQRCRTILSLDSEKILKCHS